jgi:hypothetical protein
MRYQLKSGNRKVIYQCWNGRLSSGVNISVKQMSDYAKQVGADYIFDLNNPTCNLDIGFYSPHYEKLTPILDSAFDEYETVMYADIDVYVTESCNLNIFDQFKGDLGIVDEFFQPISRGWLTGQNRINSDNSWARIVKEKYGITPHYSGNRVMSLNGGVIMLSRKGIQIIREKFDVTDYIDTFKLFTLPDFYHSDQLYLQMIAASTDIHFQFMDPIWNSNIIHVHGNKLINIPHDFRVPGAQFVHVQLKGVKEFTESQLKNIVNRPLEIWKNKHLVTNIKKEKVKCVRKSKSHQLKSFILNRVQIKDTLIKHAI